MNFGDQTVKLEGSKNTARGRKWSPSGSYDSENSTDGSIFSSHENKRKRYPCGSFDSKRSTEDSGSSSQRGRRKRRYQNCSRDEFSKAKPPTFNGEVKTGQEVEAWLLGIRKYFQVQDYSGNMKARVAIFSLTRRASIWWEHFRQVKKINQRKIVPKHF